MKKSFLIFLSALLLISTTCFTACDSWMQDDDFYGDIENDVKVANAATVSAYVRYANSKMGTTTPSGYFTFKEDVPSTLTAVTNDDYGFVRWAAFSTNDFPAAQQHSNLFYENADKYAEDFQPLELPASEVIFSDPDKTTTKITLETTRSDIFITPLVAKRPTVVTSVPSNGRSDVVRNTSIRILFSKKIDPASLKDEFGNSNIVVTSGSAVLTETSGDLSAKDVTNNCTITLGKSGKMLTISPNSGFYFDNNSQITVNIYEDVCDVDGYGMNGKYSFSFTTGVKLDSLAPYIKELWASPDADFSEEHRFYQYKYIGQNENEPVYKTEIDSARNTLSDYTDVTGASHYGAGKKQILEQRVKDFLNIYVEAADIAGSGGNVTVSTDTTSESDVALVQVRACLYIDKDGNPVTTSSQAFAANTSVSSDYYIETRDIGYAPGLKDSDCRIQSTFEDVFPNRAGGTLFTYDLRSLPDGLIKIDIWGVDMVGNSGETESYVQQNYNNNYRSIFVVKDSTPPAAATEVSKVKAQTNTAAPYKWFNAASLSTMQIADETGSANLIHDACNVNLRSKDNKLKWIFKVGNDPNWTPSPTAVGWTDIHDTNNSPIVKTLTEAVSSSDGPVDITMCLKDDLDNVSAPVLLNSINYDNTAPVLSTPGWVKKTSATSDVYEDLVATTNNADLLTSGHILKIPFTEEWAGLRRMQLTVQKDGTGQAITQTGFTVRFEPDSGDARDLSFNSTASTNDYKVFSVDDTNPVKSGTLYISGIQIGDVAEGTFRVTVDLWDSSLNHSVTHSDISIDKTDPELKKVYIPGLKHSVQAGAGSNGLPGSDYDGWFLPREYVKGPDGQAYHGSVAPGYIPLYLFIKEKDSGIHKISFASSDSVALFSSDSKSTTLYKIDNFGQTDEVRTQLPTSDYTIDVTNKTITLINNPSVKLSSSSDDGFVLLIKDIGFKSVTDVENTIKVTVEDLATLQHSNVNGTTGKIYPDLTSTSTISGIKVDSWRSATDDPTNTAHIPYYTLSDRGSNATSIIATAGYTNEKIINVSINVGSEYGGSSASSGYNSFKLSGAKFIPDGTNKTVVKLGTNSTEYPFELSQNNTVITFKNTTDYIVFRSATINISNIELDSDANESQTVSITAYDLAGWDHTATNASIILDTTAPVLEKGPFTAVYKNTASGYDSEKTVYPHSSGENATGASIGGFATFFTSQPVDANGLVSAAVIGIRATDNIALSGTTNGSELFFKCLAADKSREQIIASTSPFSITPLSGDAENSETDSLFNFTLETGTYSAVLVDKAGNTSDVFKFKILEDSSGPSVTNLNNYVYLESPDASSTPYPNEASSFSDSNEFQYKYNSTSNSIRTKKYVTKKSSGKYKIILNLAATKYVTTNATTMLANGSEPTSGADYGEFVATASSSPIEEYAVTTRYSNFPYEGHESTSYRPQVLNDNDWHKFVKDKSQITDEDKNTDSYNGIVSYVKDNNIIIELPQQNTAPVSVFLKDACGNDSWIVLGLQNASDNNKVAPSFILDDHLGYAATDANGEVVTPIVMQNPYMTSGGTEHNWGEIGSKTGYFWNNQSGNTDGELNSDNATTSYGETGKVGFVRDRAKKATYYNPDINSAQSVKIGLTLRFGQAYNTRTNPESVTFEIGENQKAPAADVTAKKYTARALLYCTQSNTKPTKQDILNCYNLEFGTNGVAGVATGRITDWTYVQANNSTTTSEVTLLLDYPKPDYSKLTDWTLKNSNNEPEPYYIWYLYEDRVGNYEIAKIVNSGAVGDALKALKTNTSEMYDRWFYDGEKPKITIRGETTKPEDIESTSADDVSSLAGVNKLIATNNGYVPYLKQSTLSGTVYVSASQNHTIRALNLKNPNDLGNGTTHHVEEAGDDAAERVGYTNRTWLPFFDIEVSEATGIRAFCWSNSSTAPAFDNSLVQSTNNTQGDYSSTGAWYAGYTATTLNADIGCDFHYDGSTNGRDATNAYFSYTDSSSAYKGVYSGTKVNTVIPFNRITSGAGLWLHVMDWTGNVQTVRMGKNLVYAKDITKPVIPDGTYTGVSEPNKYYISKDSNNQPPLLRIAGNGTYATSHDDIEVDLPGVSDDVTGILGYSLGADPVYNYSSTDIKGKLTIPWTTYSSFGTKTENATSVTYYVYDKVGNISQGALKCVFDATPPSIASVALMQDSSDVNAIFCDLENGEVASTEGRTYTHPASSTFHENAADITAAELQKIYIKKANVAKFKVNLTAATDDIYNIEVRKWNGTTWASLTSIVSNSNAWSNSDPDVKKTATSFTMSAYNVLGYETSGSIYQILATDISGNTSCQYFKLYLDNVAPTFEVEPTVTIGKGSINKDAEENVYYYTADNDHKMSVTFTLKDENGIGGETLGTNNKLYYRIGTSGSWKTLKDASENLTRSVTLQFTNETVESIYVKDALGNVSLAKPLKYVYGKDQNDQDLSVSISKLQYYSTAVSTDLSYDAESGWENSYQGTGSCTILEDSPKGVIIKDKNHQRVKITFTPPTGVIGYVADSASEAVGVYSMKKSLKTEFEVVLPTDKSNLTKTFYAVDYVGKTHQFDLLLTYNNPLAAQDIVFLPAGSDEIPADLATDLNITLTPTVDNGTTRYYKNGWIVVRCTLKKNDAGTAYSATPTTVKLYDTNSITNYTSALSTHTGTSLKTYSSTTSVGEGVNKRYYYYLAFQLSNSHKDKTLYCVMTDASNNTSDATSISNVTVEENHIPTVKSGTWTQDTKAPTITEQYVVTENSINKLKGFVLTKSDNTVISNENIGKARDNFKGQGFQSNIYPSGAKVFFRWRHSSSNQYIKDNSGVIAKYKFVVTSPETSSSENFNATASASDNDWIAAAAPASSGSQDIFDNLYCYEFALPDVTSPHCHLALFLMDSFGNVSDPYYLIHKVDDNLKVQWWLKESTLSDYTYSKSSDNKTISIKLPLGTVVSNISATGATISSIEFTDYTKGQPALSDISQGWIVLKDSDSVGLKVTFSDYTAAWTDTDVKLKINDVEKTVHTILARELTGNDIALGTISDSNTITLTVDAEAKDKITGVTATGATANLNTDKNLITLTDIPDASWTDPQTVTLTINTTDGDFNKGTVLTINKKTLTAGGFGLGTMDSENKVLVTFTDTSTPATIINASGHKLKVRLNDNVSDVSGADVSYDSTSKKFTITGMPAANWGGQQDFYLEVSTRDGAFVKTDTPVWTIAKRTIQPSDITVTSLSPATLAADTKKITFGLTPADGIEIDSDGVKYGGTILLPSNGIYTLGSDDGPVITEASVTITTNNHGEVTKNLYAGGNSNIRGTGFTAGGITAFGGGAGSGDAAGSRITQFFNNVANVFVADSTAEKPVAQNKQAEKEAKALAKAAKKATKKAKKAKKSQAATSPVVELPQSDSINTTVTTDTMMPVIEWEQSDRIETTSVADNTVVETVTPVVESGSPVVEWELSDRIETTADTTSDKHSSTSAIIVVMLAVLSSAGGAWYTLKRRKK